jgi:hypothetical protein
MRDISTGLCLLLVSFASHHTSSRVGDEKAWSQTFEFTPLPARKTGEINLIAYGDMGVKWPNSLLSVNAVATRVLDLPPIDLVLHAGDLAYAFGNFTKWNIWFERIEKIAAHVPYTKNRSFRSAS